MICEILSGDNALRKQWLLTTASKELLTETTN